MKQYILQSKRRISKKMIEWAEANKQFNSAHSYWEARSDHILLTMTECGRDYPWHTDSHNIYGRRNARRWTQILYLSPGSPIQFGTWQHHDNYTVDSRGNKIPTPESICTEVYPSSGLQIQFPSFFIHRVPTQKSEQHRWTLVTFLDKHPTDYHEALWKHAYREYFNNFTFARP